MSLPKLDTIDEQQKKRFERSKYELLSIVETLEQIEFDLNMFSDYLDEDELFVAKVKVIRASSLIKEVIDNRVGKNEG